MVQCDFLISRDSGNETIFFIFSEDYIGLPLKFCNILCKLAIFILYYHKIFVKMPTFLLSFLSHLFPLPCGAVVQFPARGSTQVLLCLLPGVVAVTLPIYCRSTSSVKSTYIQLCCVAGIHGGCG